MQIFSEGCILLVEKSTPKFLVLQDCENLVSSVHGSKTFEAHPASWGKVNVIPGFLRLGMKKHSKSVDVHAM